MDDVFTEATAMMLAIDNKKTDPGVDIPNALHVANPITRQFMSHPIRGVFVHKDLNYDYFVVDPSTNPTLTRVSGNDPESYEDFELGHMKDGIAEEHYDWMRMIMVMYYNFSRNLTIFKYMIKHGIYIQFKSGRQEKEFKLDLLVISNILWLLEITFHGKDFGGVIRVPPPEDKDLHEEFKKIQLHILDFRTKIVGKLENSLIDSVEFKNQLATDKLIDSCWMVNHFNKTSIYYLVIEMIKQRFNRKDKIKDFMFLYKKLNLAKIERIANLRMPQMTEEKTAKELLNFLKKLK